MSSSMDAIRVLGLCCCEQNHSLPQGKDVVDLLKQAVKRRGLNIEVELCPKSEATHGSGGGDLERHDWLSHVDRLEGTQVSDRTYSRHRHQRLLPRERPSRRTWENGRSLFPYI